MHLVGNSFTHAQVFLVSETKMADKQPLVDYVLYTKLLLALGFTANPNLLIHKLRVKELNSQC